MKYLVLVSLLWSFSFGIIKYGLSEVAPSFISYARNLIALVFFTSISLYQFKKFQWDIKLVLIGAIQFGLMYVFYIQSYQYLPAYLIATFTITTPIFISIADKYFFKNLITLKDALATLTEFTSLIIGKLYTAGCLRTTLILCGGGRKNKFLVQRVKKISKHLDAPYISKIKLIDDYGIKGDFVESQAFGYLAIRSYLSLPITFPNTTGCKKPTTGGIIIKNF